MNHKQITSAFLVTEARLLGWMETCTYIGHDKNYPSRSKYLICETCGLWGILEQRPLDHAWPRIWTAEVRPCVAHGGGSFLPELKHDPPSWIIEKLDGDWLQWEFEVALGLRS